MTVFPQDDSKQFARLLLKDGLIRQDDWHIAESIQQVQGGQILEILLGLCPLSEEDLYQAVARQLDYPFWTEPDLINFEIPEELLLRFPVSIALECDFLPLKWEEYDRSLHIILSNPLDAHTLDAVQMYAQADELVIGVATPSDVVTAIQVHYKQGQDTSSDEIEPVAPMFSGPEPSSALLPEGQTSHGIAPPKRQLRECPACHNMEPLDIEKCTRCTSPMDLASADPFLEKTVKGFRLTHKLGEGGMGLVYGAKHNATGDEAAVKILRTHLSSNERVVRRFHREAQAQNLLQHPNIVQVHDFGFETGLGFFIAMEFLRGLSMEEILEDHMYKVNLSFIRSVLRQVCDAMGLAHSRGVFHRDLKPDNIFLLDTRESNFPDAVQVKILDFGVAKMVASEEDERLTRTGMTIGTPRYMAPEQAGDGNTDHRSDIYSMGVILFEMLTGHPPFEGSSAYQIMLRHVYADPPALSHLRPEIPYPAALEDFVTRVLAKEPQHRPASMDLFWQDLSPALEQLEALIPSEQSLHTSSNAMLPQDGHESPSITSEPPLLIGRIAPDDPTSRATLEHTPETKAPWSDAPGPLMSAAAPPVPVYVAETPNSPPQADNWLDEGELDVWEDDLGFEADVPKQAEFHEPLFSPDLFDNPDNDRDSFGSQQPAISNMPDVEEPPFTVVPSHNTPSPPPRRNTPPPATRLPSGRPTGSRITPVTRSTGNHTTLDPESADSSSSSERSAFPKSVSLRSGRQNQRNRFSNALKQQKSSNGERSRYFLLIVIGLLLFGGGLTATWLFLIRGG